MRAINHQQNFPSGYNPNAFPNHPNAPNPPNPQNHPNNPNQSKYQPTISSPFLNQPFINAQMTQMFTNQFSQYSEGIVNKGKSYFDNQLKYYFAVDTTYVIKKVLLLFFPLAQKEWSVKYSPDGPIAPKDDINAPDLYIPAISYVTYLLVASYIMGISSKFAPQELGLLASSSLGWFLFELLVFIIIFYATNFLPAVGFFHFVALSGYKFVFMIAIISLRSISMLGYYLLLAYSSAMFGYFLLRTLHMLIETRVNIEKPRSGLYTISTVCLFQPVSMYFLAKSVPI